MKVKTYQELFVWQRAMDLVEEIYKTSRGFPREEIYGITSQIRRAALSLTNNIAEGHGRYHYLDQIKFTLHSRGSLEELIDDLNVCEDEQYLPVEEIASLKEDAWRVRKLIDGYVRYLRQQITTSRGFSVREDSPPYDEEIDDSRFSI